jgi:esterase
MISAMQDQYIYINGIRLHYVEWGNFSKQPFVLLHGLSGFARDWDRLCRTLENEYRLLALDQRGFGDSDYAPGGAYAITDFASDLFELQQKLELYDVVLLGHSLGGRIALHYTAHYPDRVSRLILVDTGPEVAPAGAARVRQAIASIPDRFESLNALAAYFRPMYHAMPDDLYYARIECYARQLPDGSYTIKRDPIFRERMSMPVHSGPLPEFNAWLLLRQIECPILLVWGGRSDMLTSEIVQRMQDEVRQLTAVEIPDVGHNIPAEAPDKLEHVIRRFLAETK